MTLKTNDLRVTSLKPLISPSILQEELPLDTEGARLIATHRKEISRILHGKDDRLVVVVGPCSIHDPQAALEYAGRLAKVATQLAQELLIVMRVYFEKPRTTVGWKGLINDPRLDGSYAINEGLHTARKLLLEIVAEGLPTAGEFLDPISPQFTSDLVAWGAIGARTTESQVHRELASGLSMPVGFKNGTNGSIKVAVEGAVAARHPHRFLGVTDQGLAAIVATGGNPDGHIILRGAESGPNYDSQTIQGAREMLLKEKLPPRMMVDISHGNSGKDHRRQPEVAAALGANLEEGLEGVFGLMMESFLVEGKQELVAKSRLRYGQSITDGCMSWETTLQVLKNLAKSAKRRRTQKGATRR